MKFSAKSTGGLFDPYNKKNPIKLQWDAVVDNFNQNSPNGVNKMI